MSILTWVGFALGGLLCLMNFYLSFLRYPLLRLRGLPRESFRFTSGIPLLGSLFVALSLLGLHSVPSILPVAIVLIAMDTGGIHWFVGTITYQWAFGKKHG